MDIQTIIVVLIVLAAAFYMGRRAWRSLRAGSGKGGDDGCGGGSCCH
ncbi:MAG TPA: FeoB-associated Cys-rich membrane protein [Gemmatimonadales bacterium]